MTAHLKTGPSPAWQALLDLIPAIEQAASFGVFLEPEEASDGTLMIRGVDYSDVVDRFVTHSSREEIRIIFDWMAWKEGQDMLDDPALDLGTLDLVTLRKMVTMIIRAERFSEGTLLIYFENGTVLRLLKAIRKVLQETRTED